MNAPPTSTSNPTSPSENSEPQFGMMLSPRYAGEGGDFGYGTLLRIKSVQVLPDDRSVCECEAVGRFRVLQTQALDGYALARTEPYVPLLLLWDGCLVFVGVLIGFVVL